MVTARMVLNGIAVGALVACAAWIVPCLRAALTPPDPARGHQPPVPLTPARHDLAAAGPVATAGEPVKPPVAAGKEPTPGSAAAPDNAARESTEAVVDLGAGVARPEGPLPLGAGANSGPRPLTAARLIADSHGAARAAVTAGAGPAHDPDREGAGGWPPGPPPHPRPSRRSI